MYYVNEVLRIGHLDQIISKLIAELIYFLHRIITIIRQNQARLEEKLMAYPVPLVRLPFPFGPEFEPKLILP